MTRRREVMGAVADVLIRGIPEAVLAGVDARATRLGLSRVEYIRRRLAADAAVTGDALSVDDLRALGDRFADLASDEVMGDAWR